MLWEFLAVTLKKPWDVCFGKIYYAPHFLRLTSLQAIDAKISMQAGDDALKQILVWLPSNCANVLFIF